MAAGVQDLGGTSQVKPSRFLSAELVSTNRHSTEKLLQAVQDTLGKWVTNTTRKQSQDEGEARSGPHRGQQMARAAGLSTEWPG